ncbi:hypothetical protein EVAR_8482_1 [Eumeta japonica]|uniref:Uncharacterized protein n=1 Tax=Eumeta variegata TaxID=151549 RepID=A0A4C1XLV3_EUMVA|nr:hypothetical protein EVAR_8482_1 [Eumeta japonica]
MEFRALRKNTTTKSVVHDKNGGVAQLKVRELFSFPNVGKRLRHGFVEPDCNVTNALGHSCFRKRLNKMKLSESMTVERKRKIEIMYCGTALCMRKKGRKCEWIETIERRSDSLR